MCPCESKWLRGMGIWTPLSKTWPWSEDQRWRSLTYSGPASLSLWETTNNWCSHMHCPLVLVLFQPYPFQAWMKKSHPPNGGHAPTISSAITWTKFLPEVLFHLLRLFVCYHCKLLSRQLLLWTWNDDTALTATWVCQVHLQRRIS